MDGSDDDALSKLIGKRSQIKRQKRETMEEIEEKLAASIEPVVDLDLDQLPEFKVQRTPRKEGDKDTESTEEDTSSNAAKDAPIVDYMADYDDENDWHIPNRIGISSISWGDVNRNFVVAKGSSKLTKRMQKMGQFVAGDVQLAVQKLWASGVLLVETSSSYGAALRGQRLSAHDILKECVTDAVDIGLPEPILLESLGRTDPTTWKSILFRPSVSMIANLEETLGRLGVSNSGAVDMFIVPKYWGLPTRWLARGLAAQIESGQANYVGVAGVTRLATLKALVKHLQQRDCMLTANMFPFSLTNQRNLPMLAICKELGVVPLISDPLDGGLASGVFTATNPSGGMTAAGGKNKFSFAQLEKLQPLHSVQETIAERVRTRVIRSMRETQERFKSKYGPPPIINTDITTTQVALQYVIAKGGVPLPEVNSPSQADEILGCLGWTLNDDEVYALDSAIALVKLL
jgi:aryl-alcohol dehydrogenase-like predicted oxidoreductase